ncbi:MAG: hypothetical protein QOJ30_2670 [Pseudonocardiales bacterium]|nr:hypothetical protein [Pseudonocardiales bacterium]
MHCWLISRSAATCATRRPAVTRSRTSRRNSGGYRLAYRGRTTGISDHPATRVRRAGGTSTCPAPGAKLGPALAFVRVRARSRRPGRARRRRSVPRSRACGAARGRAPRRGRGRRTRGCRPRRRSRVVEVGGGDAGDAVGGRARGVESTPRGVDVFSPMHCSGWSRETRSAWRLSSPPRPGGWSARWRDRPPLTGHQGGACGTGLPEVPAVPRRPDRGGPKQRGET